LAPYYAQLELVSTILSSGDRKAGRFDVPALALLRE